jgi:hypothetical protein
LDNDLNRSIGELLLGAEELFGQVLGELEPYREPRYLVHMLFFRRFTEWQCEYCKAIRRLNETDCLLGAIPVLRSLVEVSAAQVRLQRDTDYSILTELLDGERIRIAGILKDIGWPDSQRDIYARLSNMAHPTITKAFLGKTLDLESEPLKSFVARKDLLGIANMILWHAAPESEKARQDRWVFVALNTFDLTVSSLFALYGPEAPERGWWGQFERLATFEALAEQYPNMKAELLWFRLPWMHSKESEMKRDLDSLFNSE